MLRLLKTKLILTSYGKLFFEVKRVLISTKCSIIISSITHHNNTHISYYSLRTTEFVKCILFYGKPLICISAPPIKLFIFTKKWPKLNFKTIYRKSQVWKYGSGNSIAIKGQRHTALICFKTTLGDSKIFVKKEMSKTALYVLTKNPRS